MSFQGDSIFWVEVGKIVPNPFQPRKEFNEDRLKELAESIRMYGILQPLTVTRKEIQEESGAFHTEYELIAGERRLRASRLAGLEQVPVIIRSGEDTEQEKLELAIIENLQREDLNAVDRALAFKQLADVFKLSHEQVGKKVGRSRMYVSNSIRLLGLPECILNSVSLGDISEGHARTLLMLKDRPEEQDVVYREILLKKLSVREVERIARKIATDKVRKKKWENTDAHLIDIERAFTNTLGTRVQIAKTDFGGKLTIDYFSDEDLQKLLILMQSEGKKLREVETGVKNIESDTPQTVIQDMSPEAAVLAKLSVATPLEVVNDTGHKVEEESKEVVVEDVATDVSLIHAQEETQDALQSISTTPIQEENLVASQEIDKATPDNLEEAPKQKMPLSESEEERLPINLESEEFAFVRKHSEEARKEDLVVPSDYEEKMFQEHSDKKEELQEQPEQPVQENQMPTTEVKTFPVVDEVVVKKEEPAEEDRDLYSMKNFTL